jgi:RNA-directed DNA polymerase
LTLARHIKVGILRHIKVRKDYSVYDDNFAYWALRLKKFPNIPDSKLKLLKKQKGKCTLCFQEFKHGDIIETNHIISIVKEGKKTINNI